jgi:ABC-2 type transport system permease protein
VPRWFGLTWAVVGWTILVSWLLPLFDVPEWVLRLQPWGNLPHLPTDPMTWGSFLVTLGIGTALLVLGVVGYRRRDIHGV